MKDTYKRLIKHSALIVLGLIIGTIFTSIVNKAGDSITNATRLVNSITNNYAIDSIQSKDIKELKEFTGSIEGRYNTKEETNLEFKRLNKKVDDLVIVTKSINSKFEGFVNGLNISSVTRKCDTCSQPVTSLVYDQ